MNLLELIIALVVVGVLLWALNAFVPMDGKIKKILNVVVVIVLIVWILHAFGAFDYIRQIGVG